MIRFLGGLLIFLFLPVLAAAVTDDISIRMQIINDLNPPTIPDPLEITNVTDTQVTLSWGASVDDQIFGGYEIFRNGAPIATTTLTTYADSGLVPETFYEYEVRAFDWAYNYSTSSVLVSTTTLATPTPPPSSGAGTRLKMELVSLQVEPTLTTVLLSWETSRYARYELRWGATPAYEIGFVTNQVFQKQHQTNITDLEPNTRYEYELIAYDRDGSKTILSQDTFQTLAQPDVTNPPNVSRFTAIAKGNNVALSWENPETDFAYVRIVRNPLFYPLDSNNGFVAFQGGDESFLDRNALSNQDVVYYTAFVFDASGNRSSGAIVQVQRVDRLSDDFDQAEVTEVPALVQVPTTEVAKLSLENIVIIQEGEVIKAVSDTYLVDTTKPFTISAGYNLFPRHLKAIQVTLFHPVDQALTYTYLLRVNSDRTAYEAVINNVHFSGTIPLSLEVLDYETHATAKAEGYIISKQLEPTIEIVKDSTSGHTTWWLLLFVVVLILAFWFLLAKRRKEDEDKLPVR